MVHSGASVVNAKAAKYSAFMMVRALQTPGPMPRTTKARKPTRVRKPSVSSLVKNRRVVSKLGGSKEVLRILQSLADAIVA